MRILLLFLFLYFSSFNVFALTICINGATADGSGACPDGTSQGADEYGVTCAYDSVTGSTSCERTDNSASDAGTWNPQTFSCSNFVNPVVGSDGVFRCPAQINVKTPKSTSAPNPSKDDKACDPSLGADSGCASQKTAAKTNDLISESNSKLGSIASSNATNSGLLGQILGTLRGIASQGAGSNSNSNSNSNGSGSGSSDSGSGDSEISTNTKSISSISPTISAIGSCPDAESFNVMGSSYEFSYKYLCDAAEDFNGLVVAMGVLSALMIVVTAL